MPAKAEMPMRASYRPESDIQPVLSLLYSAYYQSLIEMLRRIIELERIDICLEVSMMLSCLVMPREGYTVEVKEEILNNLPESRSIGFVMRVKVDADHAGNTITRKSRT
eukprot:12792041-Ditylum_brightwellii.AAC.1